MKDAICCVIGSGPAGLAAAMFMARANIKTVVFSGDKFGGQIIDADKINNCPGFKQNISGKKMIDMLYKQSYGYGADIVYKTVTKVNFNTNPFIVSTSDGDEKFFDVVIISTGKKSNRLVYIQYPQQMQQYLQRTNQQMQNFLPLKVNPAGVIPPIFASAVILLPATIASIFKDSGNVVVQFIIQNFNHGTPVFIIVDIILITFFSFFYNNVVFDAKDVAENLRKSNIFIPGTRPGEATAQLFRNIMNRLSLIGAIYLSVVCTIPELMLPRYGYSFVISGTSLLIVVNVITDTIVAIQTAMLPQKYAKTMRKTYK